jgi:predicted small secreted protein
MKKTSVVIAAITFAGLVLAACNTVKGFGRDVESVDRAGEQAIK